MTNIAQLEKELLDAVTNMHEPTDEERQTCDVCGHYIPEGEWTKHVSLAPDNHR